MTSAEFADYVRDYYRAFQRGDKQWVADRLADGFTFTSPYDDHIGRETYFERCWPKDSAAFGALEIESVAIEGAEVFIRYQLTPASGKGPFRNTEYMRFDGDRLAAVEVYFGQVNGVDPKP